jgi:hypothetical protein
LCGPWAVEWTNYVSLLKHNSAELQDQEEAIKWFRNKPIGILTTKLGYEAKIEEALSRERVWWWNFAWKLETHKYKNLYFLGFIK